MAGQNFVNVRALDLRSPLQVKSACFDMGHGSLGGAGNRARVLCGRIPLYLVFRMMYQPHFYVHRSEFIEFGR